MSIFDNCMYFSTNQLARHLNSIADEAFKKVDYTATQGFTIIAIGELDKHSPSEIAEVLAMKPSTITRFLDKLVKLELVERAYIGRNTQVNLTKKGYEALPMVKQNWKNIDAKIQEMFGSDLACKITELSALANTSYMEKNQ
ncbi:MAG: MarR family transcriptional regulator [Spirochaetaceae bacterium]|nr:MarR family transcriptional regulator [Spirochaetaceae bacterium]